MNRLCLGLCVLGLFTCLWAVSLAARADDCGCKDCAKPCAEPCAQPCAEPCAQPCETPCPTCGTPCQTCGECPKCGEFPQCGAPDGMHEIPLPDALSTGPSIDCCCPHAEYELLCGCGRDYTLCPWRGEYELLCLPVKPCKPCKRCKQDTCSPGGCDKHSEDSCDWSD